MHCSLLLFQTQQQTSVSKHSTIPHNAMQHHDWRLNLLTCWNSNNLVNSGCAFVVLVVHIALGCNNCHDDIYLCAWWSYSIDILTGLIILVIKYIFVTLSQKKQLQNKSWMDHSNHCGTHNVSINHNESNNGCYHQS